MSPVLSFVEGSEYRKELARILARQIVDEVGMAGILDGGATLVDDMLSVLSADLQGLVGQATRDAIAHALAVGLVEPTAEEVAATVQAATDRVLGAARTALAGRLADLEAALTAMTTGSSTEAAAASIASATVRDALLGPVASVMAQTGAGMIQAIEAGISAEAVAKHQESVKSEDPNAEPNLYEWQTREDDRVCGQNEIFEVSCSARHGKQLTYDEWGIFGYPGDPGAPTICAVFSRTGSNCRCALMPAGSQAATPTPVKITDAAKAGRERALAEAA